VFGYAGVDRVVCACTQEVGKRGAHAQDQDRQAGHCGGDAQRRVGGPGLSPADLLERIEHTRAVQAAVHHAADAVDRVGGADLGAVRAAIRAGRVQVLTRTLPAEYDVPRRYANVVAGDASELLAAYQAASDATAHMVARLNELAVAAQAPSRILSAARAATRVVRRNGVHGAARDWPSTSDRTLNGWDRPHSFDPVLLLRAKAVDRAARMLIAEAKRGARQPARPRLPFETGSSVWPVKTAVRVAAESFLEGPSPMLPNSATPPVAVLLRSPRAAVGNCDPLRRSSCAHSKEQSGARESYGSWALDGPPQSSGAVQGLAVRPSPARPIGAGRSGTHRGCDQAGYSG
jgi:hypothetical protein